MAILNGAFLSIWVKAQSQTERTAKVLEELAQGDLVRICDKVRVTRERLASFERACNRGNHVIDVYHVARNVGVAADREPSFQHRLQRSDSKRPREGAVDARGTQHDRRQSFCCDLSKCLFRL